jgi:hypothetical protein
MRNFKILTFLKYYSGDQIKTKQMDGTCGTCGEEDKSIPAFGRKRLRRRWWIILK